MRCRHKPAGSGGEDLETDAFPHSYLDHLIVMEEISRASGSVGLSYGAQ